MRRLALLLWLAAATGGSAQERRMLDAEEAAAYRAVGRLNVAGARFCTATLVSDSEVLTAAHCLFHPRTLRAVPLEELRFVPGRRLDRQSGVRRVVGAAVASGFALRENPAPEDLRRDVALLELDRPLAPSAAAPFAVRGIEEADGALSIVSYGRSRSEAPSLSPDCPRLGFLDEILLLDCAVESGVSGAPVFGGAEPGVVAVVSAMGETPAGRAFALAVLVEPWIERLRADLAERRARPKR